MTVVWGLIGMSVSIFVAAELLWPGPNLDAPSQTYSGSLRTNAVIFAFGG